MFGQLPGMSAILTVKIFIMAEVSLKYLTQMSVLFEGIGIGTGPGVIQDHYSPTMSRHRASPLFNGHMGNGNAAHQPQFEPGIKQYMKPSQVTTLAFFVILNIVVSI